MKPNRTRPSSSSSGEMQAIVRAAAARHGVPAAVALAFCEVESNFNPNASGDLEWAKKRPEKYRELVLERHRDNPYALALDLWHSYGLFQLLAPHFVRGQEDPRVLFDPETNADRGCAYLARLLKQAGGDPVAARLAYVGCGFDGAKCSSTIADRVRARIESALQKYGYGA